MVLWDDWKNLTAWQIGGGATAIVGVSATLYRNRFTAALRLCSRTYPKRQFKSVRNSVVSELKQVMQDLEPEKEQFIVTYGPRGIGKTLVIATAMEGLRGVVYVNVNLKPFPNQVTMTDLVFDQLWPYNDLRPLTKKPLLAVQGVLRLYNYFRPPPWVVLDLVTNSSGTAPDEAMACARELSRFGLRVIVDVSEGSIGNQAPSLSRGVNIYVDYMDWDTVKLIPQLKDLLKTIEDCHLTEQVKEIIGGCPLQLENLVKFLRKRSDEEPSEGIKYFLTNLVSEALEQRQLFVAESPAAGDVLKLFASQDSIPVSNFEGIKIPSMARVLRFKQGSYVPRYPAMNYILKNNIQSTADIRF